MMRTWTDNPERTNTDGLVIEFAAAKRTELETQLAHDGEVRRLHTAAQNKRKKKGE
jgi:hypothetical protein